MSGFFDKFGVTRNILKKEEESNYGDTTEDKNSNFKTGEAFPKLRPEIFFEVFKKIFSIGFHCFQLYMFWYGRISL